MIRNRRHRGWRASSLGLVALLSVPAQGQTGGFVVRLGNDTVHVERFERRPDRIAGTVVTRTPTTRVARYEIALDPSGRPTRYDVHTSSGDGAPDPGDGSNGWMTLGGDTLVRATVRAGKPDTTRIATPSLVLPGPRIPYVGLPYVVYELAFAEARRRANATGASDIWQITLNSRQTAPNATRVWFVGPDSAELDYFGVTRSGWRFDGDGRLLRSDWSRTTYRYRIARVADVDVDAVARSWSAADRAGAAMGPLSPRDTARGMAGSVRVLVDYSRPARRGRIVWGDVVPWGEVWRLGADFATHVVFSGNVRVGDVSIPAGTYTLRLLPSERGPSFLIINKQVRIFGTQYDATQDLARIPIRRVDTADLTERLTIDIGDGQLRIVWDKMAWTIALVEGG